MCLRFLAKCILFIVNLVFTILGIALVAVGILAKLQLGNYIEEIENLLSEETNTTISISSVLTVSIDIVAYVLIALGVVIFFIAFCGCCGSVTDSKCMLITYAVFMGVLTALKITGLVMLATNKDYWKEEAQTFVENAFTSSDQTVNISFHLVEAFLQCCGSDGPDSYNLTYDGVSYVPRTCCASASNISSSINSTLAVCLRADAYETGCSTKFVDFIEDVTTSSFRIVLFIVIAEAVLVILAASVALTIKKKR